MGGVLIQDPGGLGHGAGVHVIIGGVGEGRGAHHGGLRRAPVAQAEVGDIIHGHGVKVAHIALHGVPVFLQEPGVFAVAPDVEGDQDESAVPGGAAAPVEAPAAGGDHARKLAAGPLDVPEVRHPFPVGFHHVEVHQGLLRGEEGVAGPAVLLPVGAVGGDAVVVGQGGPAAGRVDAV